jgi:hypothetical protein
MFCLNPVDVVMTAIFFLYDMVRYRVSQKAQLSPLTTKITSHNAPDVKGCPKMPSSSYFGHPLTCWLVPLGEALGMRKKSIIIYLHRVPNYFFH